MLAKGLGPLPMSARQRHARVRRPLKDEHGLLTGNSHVLRSGRLRKRGGKKQDKWEDNQFVLDSAGLSWVSKGVNKTLSLAEIGQVAVQCWVVVVNIFLGGAQLCGVGLTLVVVSCSVVDLVGNIWLLGGFCEGGCGATLVLTCVENPL